MNRRTCSIMKVRFKVDDQWLEVERMSMKKMKRDYESWAESTLKKAKDAQDLRALREVFYQLGDRWEWDQATGAWLSSGDPLDAVAFILRLPGLQPNKERYIVYVVMAYSKGLTDQFDHLGDKERIIIERDLDDNTMLCWSTTGHGAMDLVPTDLSNYEGLEDSLQSTYLVAQPGDHALRIEVPPSGSLVSTLLQRLWSIAGGNKSYTVKEIEILSASDIEKSLDFKFHRYAQAVIDLERLWSELKRGAVSKALEAVVDQVPAHIEDRNRKTLRRIEGLLHILWFKPPKTQLDVIRRVYDELRTEPTPTEVQSKLLPPLGELAYSLNDVMEKAQYLKWKSVIDQKRFSESDVFQGLSLSRMAKEAFAVALDDILREHTLSYIGYPERGTAMDKALRIVFGIVVLPVRLGSAFMGSVKNTLARLTRRFGSQKTSSELDSVSEETAGERSPQL